MNARPLSRLGCAVAVLLVAGCHPPGKPAASDVALKPGEVRDFAALYQQNCAGCHGQAGRGSVALALANPVYVALAGDEAISNAIASGIRGTLMPAFAKRAGGTLTDEQVGILVREMRMRWSRPEEVPAATLPPYAANEPGDAAQGKRDFAIFCAGCHGSEGKGNGKGSSIVDGSFLALVSDQNLRTTVIAGRPDLGQPDWRGYVPRRVMTAREITDVVAWLAAQRKPAPGQPYASNAQAGQEN